MIGKVVEIYSEFVNISLYNHEVKIRIGDWVEFPFHSVLGSVTAIEREYIQVKVIGDLSKIKSGEEVGLYSGIKEVSIEMFGNVWGEFGANLNQLDQNFNTKNLELSGNQKYDFIPVVRAGETVIKKQKLGYIVLQKKLKYWILAPEECREYVVKKINSGTFGSGEKIVVLESSNKKYEVTARQQFYLDSMLGEISSEVIESIADYDFKIIVSQFLGDEVNSKNLNQITFLTSQKDSYELVLEKSYNLALYLTYCGNKVLYKLDLDFDIPVFESGTIVNFEGEEGFLVVERNTNGLD